jgi:hypothetical protein
MSFLNNQTSSHKKIHKLSFSKDIWIRKNKITDKPSNKSLKMSMREVYQLKTTPKQTMKIHPLNPSTKPKNNCLLQKKNKIHAKQTPN